MQYDHLGIPTTQKHEHEIWVEASRVWVTDAHLNPFGIEWLRFEPDSPVHGPLREKPHLSFRVESREQIAELSRGMKVLLEPFDAGFCVAGFYEPEEGVILELVWYYDEMTTWAERTRPAPK
jgi:hypothetical protein